MTPVDILRKYWGYDRFRPMQDDIIGSVLTGTDTLAILPTGGGKSICFQVPGLLLDGICLVVTPLVALMQDQVQQLQSRNIAAVALHSGLGFSEVRDILRDAVQGKYRFLYVSPERLGTAVFGDALPWLKLSLIAVDEAHCISQWGYDFRPSYLEIAAVREVKPGVPVLALTASATPDVCEDIKAQLRMKAPAMFRKSFERPNLSYTVREVDARVTRLRDILQKVPGSAIVYCRTRKTTQEIAGILQDNGISASYYHAGLPAAERSSRQEAWIHNRLRVMVCTNAFGMGIDKPDVRLVVHTSPPDCLENYYQEAGRAGRDEQKAYAVLLYHQEDLRELKASPDQRFPSIHIIRKVYQAMGNYLQLPVGLGQDSSYAFDLQDFVRKFKLPMTEVIHSLQAMQQGGILSFQEQLFLPSTVQVICGRQDLEALEDMDPDLDQLVKVLLRAHGGIFDHPASISEKNIAWLMGSTQERVSAGLLKLRAMGLVEFKARKETPHIRFLQHRVSAPDLYIDPLAYKARKAVFAKRVDAMVSYITMESGCRAVFIGRYFGDDNIPACGVCDLCLKQKQRSLKPDTYRLLEEKARAVLAEGPLTPGALLKKMHPVNTALFWRLLADWSAERWVVTGKDGKLRIR
jgi:ATP-dependent DNA helicase RecQ